jgi:hypothetical protein
MEVVDCSRSAPRAGRAAGRQPQACGVRDEQGQHVHSIRGAGVRGRAHAEQSIAAPGRYARRPAVPRLGLPLRSAGCVPCSRPHGPRRRIRGLSRSAVTATGLRSAELDGDLEAHQHLAAAIREKRPTGGRVLLAKDRDDGHCCLPQTGTLRRAARPRGSPLPGTSNYSAAMSPSTCSRAVASRRGCRINLTGPRDEPELPFTDDPQVFHAG